jgi:hypothetical protein
MLLYSLLNAIFLFLVVGQAIQIQGDLERSHSVSYLFNFISDVGFRYALWYVFGVSLVSLFLSLISTGYRSSSRGGQSQIFAPSSKFYVGLFFFLLLLSFVLIFVVVGLSEFLHSSRPGFQTGSTIFIVLLFLGVIPLLLKILYNGKIGIGDMACCGLSFAVTGGFSRTHLILYLVAILMAFYYARGWADRPFTASLIGKILLFAVGVAVIIVGIGALHDAQNFVHGSLGDLVNFILKNPEKSVLSIEYNYRVGIEGMSGVAGLFTQYITDPNSVHFDYGSSWLLKGSTQWLPGFLKNLVDGIITLSDDLNWYSASIVATGVESFFASFGWAAVVLYPLASYALGWTLPLWVLKTRLPASFQLVVYMLAACTIFFVHGALAVWIAFSLSYTILILAFWPIFRPHMLRRATAQLA